MPTNKKNQSSALSAPTPEKSLSAAFTPEELSAIHARGFSASSAVFDDGVLYCDAFGGMVSLTGVRRDYEEHREEIDDEIETFLEWVDCLTDMGGEMRPVYDHFYTFKVDGEFEMDINHEGNEYANTDLEYVLDMAEDFSGHQVEIIRYDLPKPWHEYLPEE